MANVGDISFGKHTKRGTLVIVAACVVIAILAIAISFSIWLCTKSIQESHEQELADNLQATTDQSAATVSNTLNDQLLLLQGISTEVADNLKDGWTKEQIMEMFDSLDATYGYKRIGFVDSDLTVCTSDRIVRKIELSDDLQTAFSGKTVITKPIVDTFSNDGERINVLRVPVYENGNEGGPVIGVLFATISHTAFDKLLDVNGFQGVGVAVLLNEDGDIIDATNDSEYEAGAVSFISYLRKWNDGNASAIDELTADLKSGSANMTYFGYGDTGNVKGMYMYHSPVSIDNHASQWQLAVIVPSTYLSSRVDDMMSVVYSMIFHVILLVALIAIVLGFVMWRSRKRNQEHLRMYAYEDALTHGANFNYFKESIAEIEYPGVIVSVDIASFKDINSVCGVKRGDEILIRVWKSIEQLIRDGELAARVNGDHFIVFLKAPARGDDADPAAGHGNTSNESLTDTLGDDENLEGMIPEWAKAGITQRLAVITATLAKISHDLETPLLNPRYGVYRWTPKLGIEECYSRALSASSHIDSDSSDKVAFFSEEDIRRLNEDAATVQAFAGALAAGEFEPFYQPKFSPEGTIVGAEALARWRKPDGTLVPPYKFIPLYERNGMIRQLDQNIFAQVCKQQAAWIEQGLSIVPISINLSRASLRFQGVLDDYIRIVNEIGISPSIVPIEVTESAIADDDTVAAAIHEFRAAGFAIHMDDFGSGYSSLAALGSMNFDALKIDKSLIDCIGGQSGENLLRHSVQLAREMDLTVTAEGVESAEQVTFLGDLGCDNIQGFYFSRPLPCSDFESLIGK